MIEWNCPCGNSYKFHGFTEDKQQRKSLDMFEVEELAKQCGLKWSTKIQNLCDMVAMSPQKLGMTDEEFKNDKYA